MPGFEIADAYVSVHPDTTGFARELRERLARIDVRARVAVAFDTRNLRYELGLAVQRAARGLAVRIAVDLRTAALRADLIAAIRAASAGLEIVIPVRAGTGGLRGDVTRAAREAEAGQRVSLPFHLPGLPRLRTAVAAAAAGLAPLLAPVVAAVEQAVEAAAGALGTLPAFGVLAAQGLAVTGLAFAGVGDALKASTGDAAAYAEALAKLPPQAQAFTRQLVALHPWLDRLRAASAGVFPGLGDALRGLAVNLPAVEAGLARTADGVSRVGTAAGLWFGSPAFTRDLGAVMTANAASTEHMGFAGLALSKALWDLVAVGAPLVQGLAKSAWWASEHVREWVAAKRESGELAAWMARGVEQVRQFAAIIVNVAVGVHNVFRAAAGGAGDVVGGIERMSEAFRTSTGTAEFQAKVGAAFALVQVAASAGAAGVRSAVGDVAAGFRAGAADPAATGFSALFQGIGAKARMFADVFRDDVVPAFQRIWPPLSTQVIPALVRLGGIVSDLTSAVLGAFFELVGTYGPTVLRGLAGVLGLLIPPLAAVAGWLRSNHTILGALATAAAVLAAPVLAVVGVFRVVAVVGALVSRVVMALRLAWFALQLAFAMSPFGVVLLAIAALVAALIFAYKNSEQFRNVVHAVLNAVKTAFTVTIGAIVAFVKQWWPYLIGLLTGGIGLAVIWVIRHWDDIKRVFWTVINWGIAFVKQWWPVLLAPITGGLSLVVGFVIRHWDTIKGVFSSAFNFIKDKIVLPVMHAIERGIDVSLGAIKRFFSTAVDGVRTIWNGLKEVAAAPVRFVVNTVYNSGIRKAWNFVASKVGLPELGELRVPGLAAGGPVAGGVPGKDSVLRWLMPGEHVWTAAEVAAAGGHGAVFALRRALGGGTQATGPGMFLGGLGDALSSAWDATGGRAVTALKDLALGALGAGFELAVTPLRALLNSVLGTGDGWRGGLNRLMQKPLDALIAKVKGKEEGMVPVGVGPGGGGGAERWRGVGLQALALAGQSASWIGLLLKRMNQESGGNPTIVNKWDSNWVAGHPSVGLMQVIGPTFRAYAGRFLNTGPFAYGTSVNPLANIFASIMYTLSRYKTLSAWGRPGGYARGGSPPPGVPFWVGEGGEPELMVLGRGARAHVTPAAQAGGPRVVNHYHLDRSMSTPEVVMEMRRQLALAVA